MDKPSTSTFDLRVCSCDRTFRKGQVDVAELSPLIRLHGAQDALGDDELEPQLGGLAEPKLRALAYDQSDAPELHAGGTDVQGKRSRHERKGAKSGERRRVSQRLPRTEEHSRRECHERKACERADGSRPQDAPALGHDPGATAARADDRQLPLGADDEPKRVRESAVVRRGLDDRERFEPVDELAAVKRDEARAEHRLELGPDRTLDPWRSSAHLELLDCEEGRVPRSKIGQCEAGRHAHGDRDHAPGRQRQSHAGQFGAAAQRPT